MLFLLLHILIITFTECLHKKQRMEYSFVISYYINILEFVHNTIGMHCNFVDFINVY